jgi:hypothetical protein
MIQAWYLGIRVPDFGNLRLHKIKGSAASRGWTDALYFEK